MSAYNGKPIAWKSSLCGLLLAFIFAVACGGTSTTSGTSKGDYDRANLERLEQVPLFPGAVEVIREVEPSFDERRSLEGYGLRVTYRVDGATSVETIAKFYLDNMDKTWQSRDGGRLVLFCKDESFIGIDATYLASDRTYNVFVDYKYLDDEKRLC
jgi:hypothetical protein